MRPRRWYCVFDMGLVHTVCEGAAAARAACQGRRQYLSFSTQLAAEEYAAWWNHERKHAYA